MDALYYIHNSFIVTFYYMRYSLIDTLYYTHNSLIDIELGVASSVVG